MFNHPNWGAPVTGITANNFMRFTPGSAGKHEHTGRAPGSNRVPRAVLGMRVPGALPVPRWGSCSQRCAVAVMRQRRLLVFGTVGRRPF